MKKILITGGMGFIGKFLTRKLLATTDYNITIVDSLVASLAEQDIISNPRVIFHQSDLDDWEVPKNEKYHHIYHLAAPVGPVRVLEFAGRIAGLIISHVEKMADMAIAMDAKLMFISTSELYGKHSEGSTPEHVDKVVPDNITVRLEYGVGKLMGEIVLKNLSTAKPLKYIAVRPFNIIGPQQNAQGGFVIPRFLEKALANEDITVYGDGKMVRTFTHVDDFTDALITLMDSDISAEIFNIGNPDNSISILDLAKRIKIATNSQSEISLVDPKKLYGKTFEEAWDKKPDVSKLVKMTNWQPKWNLDKIIDEISNSRKDFLMHKSKAGMKLIVTVDTEADHQKKGDEKLNINNFFFLPRFQTLCEKYNFIPTYLVSYEIAVNDRAVELLKGWQVENKAEVGAHLHPWTAPPLNDKDKYLRYPSELSDQEFKEKLQNLTTKITEKLGKKPLSYRAGRWGWNDKQAKILKEMGYLVDCSVSPKINWSNYKGNPEKAGGPNFSKQSIKPYYLLDDQSVLEVPMTIVHTGIIKGDQNVLGRLFNKLPEGFPKVVINKLFFQKKWLRVFPNSQSSHWAKIYKSVKEENVDVLQFMIHSSELALGASNQTKVQEDVDFTFEQLEKMFAYFSGQGVEGIGLTEYASQYKEQEK